jgi:membrane protein implicated in regulation of membrane protease activity
MPIDPIFWLIAAIGFLVLEGMTFSMVSIWFAAGSAAALLSCLFWPSFRVQAVVFIVVSILCLAAFKPLADKLRRKHTPTNGDRSLGREAKVLTPVSAGKTGRVRLDGVDWNARCATPGDTLTPGQSCRVAEIHSTLLIVEPILTETAAPVAH